MFLFLLLLLTTVCCFSECFEEIHKTYGEDVSYSVPRQADFLEFTPRLSRDQPKILWNRTGTPSRKRNRGQMWFNSWEINKVSQADNGYYSFRSKEKTLLSRIKLTVSEKTEGLHAMADESVFIKLPLESTLSTMTYTRESDPYPVVVMKAGHLVEHGPFVNRIWEHGSSQIELLSLQPEDSGNFYFRDQNGNLALAVDLTVEKSSVSTAIYVAVPVVIIFVLIFCCCCVKKCCCKKGSSKSESAPQTAVTPAAYYHDANQNTDPGYVARPYAPVYSYRPWNATSATEPTSSSTALPVLSSAEIHVSAHQPEIPAPRQQQAAPVVPTSDLLSSDSEPKFELKGLTFPCAPPLSSDSTFCDVYTSDKLNFL